MGRPEATVENYLKAEVKRHQGETRKLRWIARRGAPDQFVLLPRYQWHGLIEVKAPGEKVKRDSQQEREIETLRAAGVNVEVVSSRDEVDALIARIIGDIS